MSIDFNSRILITGGKGFLGRFVEHKLKSLNKRNMYSDKSFDYFIRPRQACNIVYNNENFRLINKHNNLDEYEREKNKQYGLLLNDCLLFSPYCDY